MLTTPWIGRLAAVLLLIAAITAVYALLVERILVGHRDKDLAIEEVNEQLSHYQRLAAMRPVLARRLENLAAEEGAGTYYLSGGTDALAAAGLQDRVSALIGGKGGTLQSVQPMAGVDEQGFKRISLRIQMTATAEELFETLYVLETGTPVLFVENLDIRSKFARRPINRASAQEAPDAPLLTVGFDLSGYMPLESR